jgi:hypothetical protein
VFILKPIKGVQVDNYFSKQLKFFWIFKPLNLSLLEFLKAISGCIFAIISSLRFRFNREKSS